MQTAALHFGEKLRRVRTMQGMSAAELARQTGVTRQEISRYEAGDRSPRYETLVKLAEALGVSLSEFDR